MGRHLRLALLLSVAGLVVLSLAVVLGRTEEHPAEAHYPPATVGPGTPEHAALDFSIAIDTNGDTTDDCSSSGAPTDTCSVPAGGQFDVRFYLNDYGDLGTYQAYDAKLSFTSGLLAVQAPGPQQDPWPDCDLPPPPFYAATYVAIGCITLSTSTYTGLLATVPFECVTAPTSEAITLEHDFGGTALTAGGDVHSEAPGGESLDISCEVASDTPTPTSTPTATPTRTSTPTRTPTRTPTTTPGFVQGDLDLDGDVDSVDALWVLRLATGLVQSAPAPTLAGDVDKDSDVDSVDALLILQREAGLIPGF